LDLEALITDAMKLYQLHPPESLPFRSWQSISRHSVLKTSRDLALQATPQQAGNLFKEQTRELRRDDFHQKALKLLWKYRKPATAVGLAIMVAVASYWIRKNEIDIVSIWSYFGRFKAMFRSRP